MVSTDSLLNEPLSDGITAAMRRWCKSSGWDRIPVPVHTFGFGYNLKEGALQSISEFGEGLQPHSGYSTRMLSTVINYALPGCSQYTLKKLLYYDDDVSDSRTTYGARYVHRQTKGIQKRLLVQRRDMTWSTLSTYESSSTDSHGTSPSHSRGILIYALKP